jgi:hypothetical protein
MKDVHRQTVSRNAATVLHVNMTTGLRAAGRRKIDALPHLNLVDASITMPPSRHVVELQNPKKTTAVAQ